MTPVNARVQKHRDALRAAGLRPVQIWVPDTRGPATVTVLPVSSDLVAAPLFRIAIEPTTENGLHKRSQVMADKAVTVRRDKVGPTFGRIDADSMVEVERCLAVFLGIAK